MISLHLEWAIRFQANNELSKHFHYKPHFICGLASGVAVEF